MFLNGDSTGSPKRLERYFNAAEAAVKIAIDEIETLMLRALELRGIKGKDAEFVVWDFLSSELQGHRSHGVGKFLLLDAAIEGRKGNIEEISARGGNPVLLDCNGEIGQLAAKEGIERAVQLMESQRMAAVGMINHSRYSRLGYIAEKLADLGFASIVTNSAGPPAVPAMNAIESLYGTNPICFGFPASQNIIIDFATSERPWGDIRDAVIREEQLPFDGFIDEDGKPTRDPDAANAVKSFGAHKGNALCMAIEILCGCLLAGLAGEEVETQYQLGSWLIVFDPKLVNEQAYFRSVEKLIESIEKSTPIDDQQPVRVPGRRSLEARKSAEMSGEIEIDPNTLEYLTSMSAGGRHVLESNNKLD